MGKPGKKLIRAVRSFRSQLLKDELKVIVSFEKEPEILQGVYKYLYNSDLKFHKYGDKLYHLYDPKLTSILNQSLTEEEIDHISPKQNENDKV